MQLFASGNGVLGTVARGKYSHYSSIEEFEYCFMDKNVVPQSDPPSAKDVDLLYKFLDHSHKLMVLTGAGISTEAVKLIMAENADSFANIYIEFVRSKHARRRYWARSYAGWRRFTAAQPGPTHAALASLEKVGCIDFMVTQNVDRKYVPRQWALAVESTESGHPGSEKSFGMQQRPDGDIEIDEKFWEEDFVIPNCQHCNGLLKPDVVFFGDNVPKDRADKAMEAAKGCDSFLVVGSSLMTMSAFRLVRAAADTGANVAIVNIGETRADDFVPLKINARCGEGLLIVSDFAKIAPYGVPCHTSFCVTMMS
ncbi:NAD-dependent protein deacetylase srt2 [Asimina triloba]